MNHIQLERIKILKNVIDNIGSEVNDFADTDVLKNLLRKRHSASKKATGIIWDFVPKDDPRRLSKIEEEAKVQRYKDIVEELDAKIKAKEIEILFFGGITELNEIYDEFYMEIEKGMI